MSADFQLALFHFLLFFIAGCFLLWLVRTRVPVFFCMVCSFFWGLAQAWDHLWAAYHAMLSDALQRIKQPVKTVESTRTPGDC